MYMRYSIVRIALLFTLIALLPLQAQMSSLKEKNLDLLPQGVSIHRLDNGIEVLLIENSGLPMTGVNVVVKTGSAYETFATSGMSHMLEHLLFNGTESRKQKELYDAVDLIGGYNNANTSDYYTNYMMVTPAENIKKGMEIQADMLFNSILPEDKFAKEKGIVLEEIARSLENTDDQMERNIRSVLYAGHALSLPTLGTYATIQAMTRDDVYHYYKNTYVPNNMIMSVVGHFTSGEMLETINEIYGKAKPNLVPVTENINWRMGFDPISAHPDAANNIHHRFYKGDKMVVQLYYDLPMDWMEAHYILLDEILSKSRTNVVTALSKNFAKIDQQLSIETVQSPVANFLKISVIVEDPDQTNNLISSLRRELKNINFQLPDESVQFLATKTRTTFLKNIEKPHMFGIYNANNFAVGGINNVLASYSTQVYKPAGNELSVFSLPDNPQIMAHYPAAADGKISSGSESLASLSVDKTSGATIIAEQNPTSNLLAVHFLFKHKAPYESQYGKNAAMILHDCLGQRFNSVTNQKISLKFGLTYKVNDNPFIPMDNIYLHTDFSYVRIEGLAEDIPGIVNYIKDQMTGFAPTEDEYQKAFAKTKRPMGGMGSSKSSKLFSETYKAAIYEDIKYPENREPVTYEKILEFAGNFFHPSNMIISVVSPESPQVIQSLLEWDTGAAETAEIKREAYTQGLKIPSAPISEELDGGGERSFLFWGFVNAVDETDLPALRVLGLLLSDHIIFDVREKQGRAYRMKAGIDLVSDKSLFYVNLGTRPENIDPLLPQIPDFFTEKVVSSFSDKDLEKLLNMYLGRMMFRRLSSINRAYYLGYSQYFYNDIQHDASFLTSLKQVSLEDVRRVAIKYMIITNLVQVVVR